MRSQREIIDGVTVYYGGDLCESDYSEESDWEDPEDVARREYVEDYNFDLLEDMELVVFVSGGSPSGFDRQNEYKYYLYDGNDAGVPDEYCVEVMVVESTVDCSTKEPVAVSPPSMPDLSRETETGLSHCRGFF